METADRMERLEGAYFTQFLFWSNGALHMAVAPAFVNERNRQHLRASLDR